MGKKKRPKTSAELAKVNGAMSLLADLCLAMRSDPLGIITGLWEVYTCIYNPAVTLAFPDPSVSVYKHYVTHILCLHCGREDLKLERTTDLERTDE